MAQDKKQQPEPSKLPRQNNRSSDFAEPPGGTVSNTYKPPVNPYKQGKTPDKDKK